MLQQGELIPATLICVMQDSSDIHTTMQHITSTNTAQRSEIQMTSPLHPHYKQHGAPGLNSRLIIFVSSRSKVASSEHDGCMQHRAASG